MTTAFSDARTIAASPAEVWARLTDWARASEWMPAAAGLRVEGDPGADTAAVGTRLTLRVQGTDRTGTITRSEPERALTLALDVSGVHAEYRYELSPRPEGTTVSLLADVATSGAMSLFGGAIRKGIADADGDQLVRFAALFA